MKVPRHSLANHSTVDKFNLSLHASNLNLNLNLTFGDSDSVYISPL